MPTFSKNQLTKTSKFLSLLLRHKPETIDLTLDENGWANVEELLEKAAAHDQPISPELLQEVVATNEKKRFAFSDDGKQIRASQGHSLEVKLDLEERTPPALLYHGTAQRNVNSIMEQGLLKRERNHVHLSDNRETATQVGQRYGKPILLLVNTEAMLAAGHKFYLSANGVWLTDSVPAEFLSLEE